MSLVTNVTDLATRIATEIKLTKTWINGNAANLSGLNTTAKTNLVAAINEVVAGQSGAAGINDSSTTTTSTWSSSKVSTELATKQASDADLTTIAALNPTTANVIASDGAGWIAKTYTQLKTALSLTKSDVGLANVDNTSDANKPVSSATQTALNGKQPLDTDLTTIAGLTATTDSFLQSKASAWTTRTPAQVKTDLAITKSDVGLGNVDNTSDANKPISTATQTALDGKAATSHTHTAANVTDFTASVDARINTVLDTAGAGTALDTLNELAAALNDDPNFGASVTTALGNRVRVDAAQAFTGPQQTQGRDNIAAASAADLSTLSTNVGNTATNFVTTFEAGLV
jgi:hypothetical protein